MNLSQAMEAARTEATAHGHAMTEFVKDTIQSAAAHCIHCGRVAAVDVTDRGRQLFGKALSTDCTVHLRTDVPDDEALATTAPRRLSRALRNLHGIAFVAMTVGRTIIDNTP